MSAANFDLAEDAVDLPEIGCWKMLVCCCCWPTWNWLLKDVGLLLLLTYLKLAAERCWPVAAVDWGTGRTSERRAEVYETSYAAFGEHPPNQFWTINQSSNLHDNYKSKTGGIDSDDNPPPGHPKIKAFSSVAKALRHSFLASLFFFTVCCECLGGNYS